MVSTFLDGVPLLPPWMSRSYPYLSIALHFHIPYEMALKRMSLPARGNSAIEVREYAEALAAAQRLHEYVQQVGMARALQVLGQATEKVHAHSDT